MSQVRTARRYRQATAGFTMVELVIVMVLVGILAAYALPRLNTGALQVMPVAEQIAAEIRYTQNLAMTRSQEHTFEIIGNTISIQGGVPLSDGQTGGGSVSVTGGGSSATVQVSGETGYVQIAE